MRKESSVRTVFYIVSVIMLGVYLSIYSILKDIEKNISINASSKDHYAISKFVSDWFLHILVAGYLAWIFVTEAFRPRFHYELITFMCGLSVVPLFKLAASKGRPFMIWGQDVYCPECECDYGFPSGHTWTAVMIGALIYKRCYESLFPK